MVGELGCGGANFLIAMASAFPLSVFHGFEVSDEALAIAATRILEAGLTNVHLHDAKEEGESLGDYSFDVVTTFDVLHDAPNTTELIAQGESSHQSQHLNGNSRSVARTERSLNQCAPCVTP